MTNSTSMMLANFMAGGKSKQNDPLRHKIEDSSTVKSLKHDALITSEVMEDLALSPYVDMDAIIAHKTTLLHAGKALKKERHQMDTLLDRIHFLEDSVRWICGQVNLDPQKDEDIIRLHHARKNIMDYLFQLKSYESALDETQEKIQDLIQKQGDALMGQRDQHFSQVMDSVASVLNQKISEEHKAVFTKMTSIRAVLHYSDTHQIKPVLSPSEGMKQPEYYWLVLFDVITTVVHGKSLTEEAAIKQSIAALTRSAQSMKANFNRKIDYLMGVFQRKSQVLDKGQGIADRVEKMAESMEKVVQKQVKQLKAHEKNAAESPQKMPNPEESHQEESH